MISILKSYSEIIDSYEIRHYRQYGGAYELVAIIRFKDHSELHVRDYLFLNRDRKYSFHWQDHASKLIMRWDNSTHHRHLATFPFHVHKAGAVEESKPMTLEKVLEYIENQMA